MTTILTEGTWQGSRHKTNCFTNECIDTPTTALGCYYQMKAIKAATQHKWQPCSITVGQIIIRGKYQVIVPNDLQKWNQLSKPQRATVPSS